ncbi:MAG: hypothetical protein ACJ8DJ_23685, partial [Gemmatimonadales bacterium]
WARSRSSFQAGMMTLEALFREGLGLLDSTLLPHGFAHLPRETGSGSGGPFVRGGYAKDGRRLELSLRHALGGVVYHLDEAEMSHEQYMRRLLAGRRGNLYPGFSAHPLDGFRHLRHDLDRFAWDFVQGSGDEFRRLAALADDAPRLPGASR